jgi:hypothetical protein
MSILRLKLRYQNYDAISFMGNLSVVIVFALTPNGNNDDGGVVDDFKERQIA